MSFAFPPYLQGIIYSFVFLFATGPSFFYLISLSIKKGFKSGVLFTIGILLSDVLIVAIIYYGLADLLESSLFKTIFNVIGGVVLIVLGFKFIFEKTKKTNKKLEFDTSSLGLENCFKGFFMNLSNPFAFLVWLTLHSYLSQFHPEYLPIDFLMFFIGLFISILTIEVSKVFLANKIGNYVTDELLNKIHKVLGVIFIVIGLSLFKNLFLVLIQ